MTDAVTATYTSNARIKRVRGPQRLAYLPAERAPARFGTPGPIARHDGGQGEVPDPHATTIDYIVAAAGG